MSRRFSITMLGVSLALFLIPQVPLAAEDHIAEAITHTKQAIDHGKMGHADVLTTHAEADGDHFFGIGALLDRFPNARAVATRDVAACPDHRPSFAPWALAAFTFRPV